jgi:mannose-1-phosphate guanylyltransferase
VGERLRPLTEHTPKPLIPVAGRPCIDYVIRSLVSSGFKEIVVTTGYLSDRLIKRVGAGVDYDASILYSFEDKPAGTAGAVKNVENFPNETFAVASGDVLADVDVRSLYEYHKKVRAVATIALTEVERPEQFGIVEMNEENRIIRFKEKPGKDEVFSNLINAGIYILEPEVLDYIPPHQEYDFSKNVFPTLLEEDVPLYGMRIDGLWMDVGSPQDLLAASLEVIRTEGEEVSIPGVETEGPLMVGDDVTVERGVRLVGPAYLGDNAYVSRGTVVDSSCVYDHVFVDRGAVLRNSIVLEASNIGWQSEIIDSVVSSRCVIEEDVKLLRSIIGAEMTVKIHSRLEDANVSPPANNVPG